MRTKSILTLLLVMALGLSNKFLPDLRAEGGDVSSAASSADDEFLKLGLRYAEAGRFDEAIEILNEAVEENPTARRFMALGVVYLQKNDYDRAYNNLSEALSREPQLPPAIFFMAMLYEKKGMPQDALAQWKNFLQVSRKKHLREVAEKHIRQLELQLGLTPENNK